MLYHFHDEPNDVRCSETINDSDRENRIRAEFITFPFAWICFIQGKAEIRPPNSLMGEIAETSGLSIRSWQPIEECQNTEFKNEICPGSHYTGIGNIKKTSRCTERFLSHHVETAVRVRSP